MIHYRIDKGIPIPAIPEYRRRSGRPLKYNWCAMEPGDSILVESIYVARSATAYGATHGWIITVKKQTGDNPRGERGWRVWRVS